MHVGPVVGPRARTSHRAIRRSRRTRHHDLDEPHLTAHGPGRTARPPGHVRNVALDHTPGPRSTLHALLMRSVDLDRRATTTSTNHTSPPTGQAGPRGRPITCGTSVSTTPPSRARRSTRSPCDPSISTDARPRPRPVARLVTRAPGTTARPHPPGQRSGLATVAHRPAIRPPHRRPPPRTTPTPLLRRPGERRRAPSPAPVACPEGRGPDAQRARVGTGQSPAAAFSSSTLSVFSHVKSASSRPKWP